MVGQLDYHDQHQQQKGWTLTNGLISNCLKVKKPSKSVEFWGGKGLDNKNGRRFF
jgi:hypothetical protein